MKVSSIKQITLLPSNFLSSSRPRFCLFFSFCFCALLNPFSQPIKQLPWKPIFFHYCIEISYPNASKIKLVKNAILNNRLQLCTVIKTMQGHNNILPCTFSQDPAVCGWLPVPLKTFEKFSENFTKYDIMICKSDITEGCILVLLFFILYIIL